MHKGICSSCKRSAAVAAAAKGRLQPRPLPNRRASPEPPPPPSFYSATNWCSSGRPAARCLSAQGQGGPPRAPRPCLDARQCPLLALTPGTLRRDRPQRCHLFGPELLLTHGDLPEGDVLNVTWTGSSILSRGCSTVSLLPLERIVPYWCKAFLWVTTCFDSCPTVVSLPVLTCALQKQNANALHMEEYAMTAGDNDDGSSRLPSRPPFILNS